MNVQQKQSQWLSKEVVKSDNVRLISIEKLSKRRDGEQLAEPG
jgi:hypothetical protein